MRKLFLIGVAVLFTTASCDKKNKCCDGAADFDRGAMLQHYSDHIISPAFSNMKAAADLLHSSVLQFAGNPTSSGLNAVRQQWIATAITFQSANAFNFGPAGEEGLRKGFSEEIGTFPVSTAKIDLAISNGQWNLNDFNRDARGLYAIEYLIFTPQMDVDALIQAFQVNSKRGTYLSELALDLKNRAEVVSAAWQTGGYAATFVKNDGTDAGSSVASLYNEFIRSYEAAKNFKLALPLGKRAGQTQSAPQLVEAFYSGQSMPLLKAHIGAIERVWYGNGTTQGPGFKAYLESVEGGKVLVTNTELQLSALKKALESVPEQPALSDLISAENPALEALYIEMQKMVRYLKSDMSSLLGIAITYSSGDGD